MDKPRSITYSNKARAKVRAGHLRMLANELERALDRGVISARLVIRTGELVQEFRDEASDLEDPNRIGGDQP